MSPGRYRQYGLSLIELVVCTAIIAIFASYAVPSMQRLVVQNERAALSNGYFGLFAYARYKATVSHSITTICPLDQSMTCTDNWDHEVAVFPDDNGDGKPDDGQIWRQLPQPPASFHIYSRTGGRGYFRFTSSGMTYGMTGSLVICPLRTSQPTYLAVNRGGRFHQVNDDDHDGSIQLPWGPDIRC